MSFFEVILFTESKNEFPEILGLAENSTEHLQHERVGPVIIIEYEELVTETMLIEGYFILIMEYHRSSFRDFESFLEILVDLDDDDI